MKLLFVLKKRQRGAFGTWCYSDEEHTDSGLFVSALQIVNMLKKAHINAELVQVIDNNDIDREIVKHKPTHVIIEAFWVIPEKFDVLKKLHPKVTFIVRCHSKIDFLAHEGSVLGWVFDYLDKEVYVACNDEETTKDFKKLAIVGNYPAKFVTYLPNFYDTGKAERFLLRKFISSWKDNLDPFSFPRIPKKLNIGCFGAIRPLKNHAVQAAAAILVANNLKIPLNFHINDNRIEGAPSGMLKALQALFNKFPEHRLISHPWMHNDDFLNLISTMDLNMQVSLSETFNLVCADSVSRLVPVLASSELPWLPEEFTIKNANNVNDIEVKLRKMLQSNRKGLVVAEQLTKLNDFCDMAKNTWLKHFS